MHTVLVPRLWSDGKQIMACACPLGIDHAPIDVIIPAGPGEWTVRLA